MCVSVCGREKQSVFMCVRDRETERERERESMFVIYYDGHRCVCVCERERERRAEKLYQHVSGVCICMYTQEDPNACNQSVYMQI